MKICIVKLSAFGDIIHSLTSVQFLKKNIKNIQIDWICEEVFEELLYNARYIDKVYTINLKSVKKQKKLLFAQIKKLKLISENNYDYIIDAQGLIKSALVAKLLKTKSTKIIGFDKYSIREKFASLFYDIKINSPYEKNVILRNIDVMCKYFNINVTKEDILNKEILFKANKLQNICDIIFIAGASRKNKIYPKERFLALSKLINKPILVIWGNEKEKNIATWLHQQNHLIKVSKKLSFKDLIDMIYSTKIVIGGDTGPTHLAWGLNIASITIYGNTPHLRNSFITPINKTIKSNSTVNPKKLDKSDFSIKDIKEESIFDIFIQLYQR